MNPRVEMLYVLEKDLARYASMKDRWGDRMPPNVLPEDSETVLADPRLVPAASRGDTGVFVFVSIDSTYRCILNDIQQVCTMYMCGFNGSSSLS